MKAQEVRERAFAMPLTSPAYPPGPYRFIDREYLIATYRTDPVKLRALVPKPLEIDGPLVKYEFIPHARLDRLRRLHRDRAGHPRIARRTRGWLHSLHVPQRRGVLGPSLLATAALPYLAAAKGTIINVSSTFGHKPVAGDQRL